MSPGERLLDHLPVHLKSLMVALVLVVLTACGAPNAQPSSSPQDGAANILASVSASPGAKCAGACPSGSPSPAITGPPNWYMLSQQWLPSNCLGLKAGYDTTETHPPGSQCLPNTPNEMTVHGVWPSWNSGVFGACCQTGTELQNDEIAKWPQSLQDSMAKLWIDPIYPTVCDGTCDTYNHEWQKHGTCMFDNTDAGARQYFELGVDKATQLQRASAEINSLAGQTVPTARIRDIVEEVTGKPIQTACDANAATRLLEIHSCYNNDGSPKACPTIEAFGPLVPCGDQVELPIWSTTPKSSEPSKPTASG